MFTLLLTLSISAPPDDAIAALALAKAARLREAATANVEPAKEIVPETYQDILARVMAGERVVTKVRIPGEPAGWYVCWLEDGRPRFKASAIAAQAVAAKKTFPNGSKHLGHDCPNCGYEQRSAPITGCTNGGHQHTCPKCGTSWYH